MISFITHSQCGSSYVFSLAAAAAAQLLSLSLHDALPISVAGGRRRRIPHQQLLGPVGHGCEGPALRVVCHRRGRLVPGPSLFHVQPAEPRPYCPADRPLGTAGSPERQAGSGWLRVSLQSRARHLPRRTRRRHDSGLRRRAVVPAHPLSPRSRRPAVPEETVNESLAKALAL